MPPVSMLIKPASGNCNMHCKYCFYADITQNRKIASFGRMSDVTLETIVKKALTFATGECTFAFQGGEPTLVGLDFYRRLMEYEKEYNRKGLRIHNALQTNGYIIDEEWAKFLAENQFLIGLSLDGNKDINDLNRLGANGEGTYKTAMHTVQLFKKHHVEFNILSVVTAQSARNVGKIYGFFKQNQLPYQQYIPCLDPIGKKRGLQSYSLTPELYGRFLKSLFDLWYQDIIRGEFTYNRYFENLVGMLKGYPPESCGMLGHCSYQNVIEADGSIYPCDFYVLDEYKLGNLNENSFEEIEENCKKIGFVETSRYVSPKCKECKWKNLCCGGCRRDREPMADGKLSLNYFCSAYEEFFEYSIDRLIELANQQTN